MDPMRIPGRSLLTILVSPNSTSHVFMMGLMEVGEGRVQRWTIGLYSREYRV
jgi:hypothetical protein